MHKKYSNFFIVLLVGGTLFGVYSYFHNNIKSEAATDNGSLTSSLDVTTPTSVNTNTSQALNDDIAFLMRLGSLKKIKIDISLFENKYFSNLVDNSVKLEPVPIGRKNSFSPLDKPVIANQVLYSLKTNPATSITNKSAVLMGSLEGGVTSNNIYFEYGLTEPLDKVTTKVIPSMVGNFASNINHLNPKTKYLYRAAANINGVLVFGDIMSFNTN